jgi:hypothetical protein
VAGFTRIYCIGEAGGFLGGDGLARISLQILVGDGDRRWLEARYLEPGLGPMGRIHVVIPRRPDDPLALLDACLAFVPQRFEECGSLEVVRKRLAYARRLDFHHHAEEIPEEWAELRLEAVSVFRRFAVTVSDLRLLDLSGFRIEPGSRPAPRAPGDCPKGG